MDGTPGLVRRARRTAVTAVASVAAVLGLLAATVGTAAPAGAAASHHRVAAAHPIAGTFTFYLNIDPKTLDPAHMSLSVEDQISSYIGANLVAVTPTGGIVPWLASSWTFSNGGKTLTFHIRPGIKFQVSGAPFTAGSMAATLKRDIAPKTGSPVAATALAGVTSITAPNPSTLVLQMKSANGSILLNLAESGYLEPVDPVELAKWGNAYGQHPSSVGPYELQSWVPGESVTLVRNPNYTWAPSFDDPGAPYIKYLKFLVIPQQSSQVAAFASGQVDLLAVPPQDWTQYATNANYQFLSGVDSSVQILEWNMAEPMFQSALFREALAYGINRASLVTAVLQGHGLVAGSPMSPALFGYDAALAKQFPYDPAKAKQLFKQAGYAYNSAGQLTKGGKPVVLNFLSLNIFPFDTMGQLVQAQLQAIGIQAKITTLEASVVQADMMAGKYDIAMFGYGWSGADPVTLLQILLTPNGGLDATHFNNAGFTALMSRYIVTTSQTTRLNLVTQIQQDFGKYLPYLPLTYGITGYAFNKNYGGITWSNFGAGPFLDNMYEK